MTVYDLIVIGGGFWGTCCALEAETRGRDWLLLDDLNPHGASRNAAGIVSLGWYAARSQKDKQNVVANIFFDTFRPADAHYGVRFLRDLGILRQTGEEFFTYNGTHKFRDDLFLLSSPQDLFERVKRHWARVLRLVGEHSNWRVVTEDREYTARGVVLAAGAFTDDLLTASGLDPVGVTGLRGRALLIDPANRFDVPLTVAVGPYTHYTLRPWKGGRARLGDTVEKSAGGDEKLLPLKQLAERLAAPYQLAQVFDGLRPVRSKVLIEAVAPGLVVATGGHRVGLALAPRAAQLALDRLEASHA